MKQGKKSKKGKRFDHEEEPLVIIGGGTAGTYLAWRLATAVDSAYNSQDIHLCGRTDHISGRLFSPTVGEGACTASTNSPDTAHLPRTELGGMRVRTKDKILIGTMQELGIKTGPFYMNANDETSNELNTNPMYARNTLGMTADFVNKNNIIPFTRGPQSFNASSSSSDPYSPTYDNPPASPKVDATNFDPCDGSTNKNALLQPYGPDGQPYYTYSIHEAAHEFKGETLDDIKLGEAISGYALDNYEVGSASPDFAGVLPSESYSYIRPLEGMASIPNSLNDAAVSLGVHSNVNQEVTKLEQLDDGDWLVTFRETETSTCTGITKMKNDGGNVKVVRAKKVVLALPAAALHRIEFVTPMSNGALHRMINDLASENVHLPIMKLFASWSSCWWNTVNNLDTFSETEMLKLVLPPGRSTNFTCGRFTNDLVSHIFAWYPGTQSRPETVDANADACSDMGVIQFYIFPDRLPKFSPAAETEAQDQCTDEATCDVCNPDDSDAWFSPGISTRLMNLVTQDLSTMFRMRVPDANEIKYRIWSAENPVTRSDGVHFWKAGVKWWESYQDALEPVKGGNLHLIGEVFSHNQGWAEGALETAEHLVQEVMEMGAPTWLNETDYCKSMPFFENRSSRRRKMKAASEEPSKNLREGKETY